MHIPNPILLAGATPASGLILEVTAGRGGLAGYILLGQHGPPAAVEVSGDGGTTWEAPTYPHTLAPGLLRLTRTDEGASVTTLRALAPVDEAPPPEPEAPGETFLLQNGAPVTVPNMFAGATLLYSFTLPSGVTALTVATEGGTGDVGLFLRRGSPPELPENEPPLADAESQQEGNAETVGVENPQAGTWYVLVFAYAASSDVTLTATWDEGGDELFSVTQDGEGYQTITNADATTDAEGYQTIPDATATADPDGYESVERSY